VIVVSGAAALHAVGAAFPGDLPLPPFGAPFVTVTVDGAGHAASSAARICATPKLVPCATGDALTPPATTANAAARWSSFIYASQNGRWLSSVFFRAVPSFLLPLVQFFFLS